MFLKFIFCGQLNYESSKYVYLVLFALSAVITWMLRDFGEQILEWLPFGEECVGEQYEGTCIGSQAVLRLGIANAAFFGLMSIQLMCIDTEDNPRAIIHTGLWLLKIAAWIGMFFGSMLLPRDSLTGFVIVFIVLAALYQVIQLVILIDFWFVINEWLLDLSQGYWLLAIGSIFEIGASLAMIIYSYIYFAWKVECTLNIFLISISLVLGLLVLLLSVAPWKEEHVGLFIGGAVFSYGSFLLVSGLYSQPMEGNECARVGATETLWILVMGFIITMGVVFYSTLNASISSKLFELFQKEGAEESELPYNLSFFHFVFMLASAYLAMLLTGWNDDEAPDRLVVDRGYGSMWAKIGSAWLCFGLSIWALIAPSIFDDREFAV
eukprot:TRINITY_DN7633_c0_g1_i11.p1 TRINITY_DN7633_c0_g1~~TRINITY_DN7633_c0_g1_i11.p1  ORF type:complete len:380 (-),score=30.60 TRINITY_DN7633_c0_g1_i11:334-1473(-)